MHTNPGSTRRGFLGACAASVAAAAAPTRTLRLGGPIFLKSDDPAALAREHRRLGYRAAVCPKADVRDGARIAAIRQAFAAEDVVIAEVGAWVNMLEADPEKRKANLNYVTERLALAEAVGALNCIDIAGSFNPNQWDGPDPRNYSTEYFDATIENCRKVIDAVKPKATRFSLEMMPWAPPDGPDSYLKFVKAIDRPAFAVHLDICNIVSTVERYFHNAELIEECFRKLGRWTRSCHAKDVAGQRVHLAETIPGRGGLDYRAYLRAIAAYAPDAPLVIEHLSKPEEYYEARQYILSVGREVGIAF